MCQGSCSSHQFALDRIVLLSGDADQQSIKVGLPLLILVLATHTPSQWQPLPLQRGFKGLQGMRRRENASLGAPNNKREEKGSWDEGRVKWKPAAIGDGAGWRAGGTPTDTHNG